MKTFKFLATSLLALGLVLTPVHAETFNGGDDWEVQFTSDKKMESTFKSQDLDDVIYGLQPGDTAILTLNLSNLNSSTTSWYMENKVLYSLEDRSANNATSGGAYTYRLVYENPNGEENVLFDSDTVGGENPSEAGEGLHEATDSLDEWFFLDTLQTSQAGKITLTVTLDGETQGNDYQDTLADLQMNFAVELTEKPTNPDKPEKPHKPPFHTVDTGDRTVIAPYAIAATVSGILLLILSLYSAYQAKKGGKAHE